MTRHARLRLPEDRDQFADRQFRLSNQSKNTQPGNLPGGLKRIENVGKRRAQVLRRLQIVQYGTMQSMFPE